MAKIIGLLLVSICVASALASPRADMGPPSAATAFTYWGELLYESNSFNGEVDIAFRLFSGAEGNEQVGPTLFADGLLVSNGLFVVDLDFGIATMDAEYWLEITIGDVALQPRQRLSAVAQGPPTLRDNTTDDDDSMIGGLDDDASEGDERSLRAPSSRAALNSSPASAIASSGSGQLSPSSGSLRPAPAGDDDDDYIPATHGWHNTAQGLCYAWGQVGIGTCSVHPQSRLHVYTTIVGGGSIYGEHAAASGTAFGIWGVSRSTSGRGVLGHTTATSGVSVGVVGRSDSNAGRGVIGWATSSGGSTAGVLGRSDSSTGRGVWGQVFNSSAYSAYFEGGRNYFQGNVGVGTINPQAKLHVVGTTRTTAITITGGADLAEAFDITRQAGCDLEFEPGMVLVIDPENPGRLTLAREEYDARVAGIISGANGLRAGMILRAEGDAYADGEHYVALTGRVWCWVDASDAGVAPGDMLTTSNTPGHAMKVTDHSRAFGTVIGKAMTPLDKGERGLVLVLVNLQ